MRRALVLVCVLALARAGAASELGCPSRVVVPDATATFYDPIGGNACGLPIAPGEFIAALAEVDWDGSAHCGRCARVAGPLGAVTVRITDYCPSLGNGLCVAGHLDLSRSAFLEIAAEEQGYVGVAWETVACEVEGPLRIYFDPSSNPWYGRIQIRNHRYAIASVEARLSGVWTDIPRTAYNAFELFPPGEPIASPLELRVTDVHGAVVTATVPFTTGVEHDADAQLAPCPEPDLALGATGALGALAAVSLLRPRR
ncbi:MAG: hypothetical protein DCC71_22620 [Proteobacteria bacterium]|nr:MAG: hypothetical protein DCC71_22620 [Pseudomonadota bacterium]